MQTAAPGPKMSYTNLVQEVSIGYLKQILKQLSLSGVDAQHMIFTWELPIIVSLTVEAPR